VTARHASPPDPYTRRLSIGREDRHRRLTVTATAIAAVGLLIAAALAAFGLPGGDVHPPLHYLGIMDPLCGGTRAARLTVQGDLAGAWTYNPLGIVVVLGAALVLIRTLLGAVGGRWLDVAKNGAMS
jgi:hypothetical protein